MQDDKGVKQNNDPVGLLFEYMSGKMPEIGSEDTFRRKIQTEAGQDLVFKYMSEEFGESFGTFEDFKAKISQKKSPIGAQASSDGSQGQEDISSTIQTGESETLESDPHSTSIEEESPTPVAIPSEDDIFKELEITDPDSPTEEEKRDNLITSRKHELDKKRISKSPVEVHDEISRINAAESKISVTEEDLLKEYGVDFFKDYEDKVKKLNDHVEGKEILSEDEFETERDTIKGYLENPKFQLFHKEHEELRKAQGEYNVGFEDFKKKVRDKEIAFEEIVDNNFLRSLKYSLAGKSAARLTKAATGLPDVMISLMGMHPAATEELSKVSGARSLAKWGYEVADELDKVARLPDKYNQGLSNTGSAIATLSNAAVQFTEIALLTRGLGAVGLGAKMSVGMSSAAMTYSDGIRMAKEAGYSDRDANVFGAAYGGTIGMVNALISPAAEKFLMKGSVMKGGLKKLAGDAGKGSKWPVVFNTLLEGAEEGVFEPLAELGLKAAYNKFNGVDQQFELENPFARENLGERMTEFAIGTILGGTANTVSYIANGSASAQEAMFLSIEDPKMAFRLIDELSPKLFSETKTKEDLKERIQDLSAKVMNTDLSREDKMKLMILQDAYDVTKKMASKPLDEGTKKVLSSKMESLKDRIIKLTAPEYHQEKEGEQKIQSKEAEEIIEIANSLNQEKGEDSSPKIESVDNKEIGETSEESNDKDQQEIEETKESIEGEGEASIQPEAEGELVKPEVDEKAEVKEIAEPQVEAKAEESVAKPEVAEEVEQSTEPKIEDGTEAVESPFGEIEPEKGKSGRKAQSIEEFAEGVDSGRNSVPKGLEYAAKEGEGGLEQKIAEQLTRRDQFRLSDVMKETGMTAEELGKSHFGSDSKNNYEEGALVLDVASEIAEELGGAVSVEEVMDRLIDGLSSNKSNKQIVGDLIRNIMQTKKEGFEEYTEQNYDAIAEIEEQYYVAGEGIDYKGIIRDATKLGLSEGEIAYFQEAENRDYESKYKETPESEGEFFDPNTAALKKSRIKATRAKFNLDRLPKAVRKSWDQSYRQAVDGGFHLAGKAMKTANRVLVGAGIVAADQVEGVNSEQNLQQTTLSEEEHIGLTIREAEIQNELSIAYKAQAESRAKGVPSTTLDRHIEALAADLDTITRAANWTGTEAARRLSIRRIAISKNDYSIAKMMQRARLNKGAALTEEESSAVIGMSERIKEAQKNLESIREDVDKINNERLRKLAEDELKGFGLTTKEYDKKASKKAKIRAERKDVLSKIRALTQQMNDITHLSVEMPSLMYKLAKTYIADGIVELPDLVKKIKKDIPEASDRDVYIGLYSRSKNGKVSVESELQKNLRNLQREAKLLVKIENLEKGITEVQPQSKSAQKVWTKKVTDLQDKLDEMLTEIKKVEGDQKRVAAIEAKIDEIQNHIINHTFNEPKSKPVKVESPEVEEAKAKLENAKKTLQEQTSFDKMFAKITDQILEVEESLSKGEILSSKKKGKKVADPPMIREAKKRLADSKKEMQWLKNEAEKLARLQEKIEDAKAGKIAKSTKTAIAESDAIKAARETLKELETLVRLQEKQNELEARIEKGDTAKKPSKPKAEESSEIKKAKAKIRELEKLMRTQEAVKETKKNIEKLANGDLSVLEKVSPNIPIIQSQEVHQKTLKAARELVLAQKEMKRYVEALKPKTAADKWIEIYNITRTLKASIDLSGTLRQGLYMTMLNPSAGVSAFKEALRVTFATDRQGSADAELSFQSIVTQPDYYLAKEVGLEITAPDALFKSEEYFQSDVAKKIPLLGLGIKASERHMVTYLNAMRWATWQNFIRKYPNADVATQTQYARWVNVISGRGQVGKKTSLKTLSTLLFAPKYTLSRFQMLGDGLKSFSEVGGQAAGKKVGTAASKAIAKDFATQLAISGGLIALVKAMRMITDDAPDVELDPRDSDFLKLQIGNTRYDFLAGQAQALRVMVQLAGKAYEGFVLEGLNMKSHLPSSFIPKKGAYTGTYDRSGMFQIGMRFLKYKAHPMISSGLTVLQGVDPVGNPVSPLMAVAMSFVPIVFEETADQLKYNSFTQAALSDAANILGIGASVYNDELYNQDMKGIMNKIGAKPNAIVSNIPDFIRDDKHLKQEYKLEFSLNLAEMIRKIGLNKDMHPEYLKQEVRLMSRTIREHLNQKYVAQNREAILEWEANHPDEEWW